MTYTSPAGKVFEVKQTGKQFFYYSHLARRWFPIAAAKVSA